MIRRKFFSLIGSLYLGSHLTPLLISDKRTSKEVRERDDILKLTPPSSGPILVAFPVSQGFTVIDFTGPLEVFQDVFQIKEHRDPVFETFTVAESLETVRSSKGLKVVPDYTFKNSPSPQVIVLGGQNGSPGMTDWIKKASVNADVVMSVCTGAFLLAATGLIDGLNATTHHDAYDSFARMYPRIELKRNVRFTEEKKFSCAGGGISGITLALRVVERYFGRNVVEKAARHLEYQNRDWII